MPSAHLRHLNSRPPASTCNFIRREGIHSEICPSHSGVLLIPHYGFRLIVKGDQPHSLHTVHRRSDLAQRVVCGLCRHLSQPVGKVTGGKGIYRGANLKTNCPHHYFGFAITVERE